MKNYKKYILVLGLVLLCSCSKNTVHTSKESLEKQSYSFFDTFDTVVEYVEYTNSKEEFEEHKTYLEEEFKRIHKLTDNFNTYEGIKNVKSINEEARVEPMEVDPDLYNIINLSVDYYKKYSNKNNIAMGLATDTWRKYRDISMADESKAQTPNPEELEKTRDHMDIEKIELNSKKHTVKLLDADMTLDLGSIAKGYATEKVAQDLSGKGVKSAIISAGGNVRTIGTPMDGKRDKWGIGIQNPENAMGKSEEPVSEVLYLGETSVVTSGDYQRFFTVKGQNYHHIIDPDSLMPLNNFRSVSIVTKDSGLADFLSTAVFNLSLEEGKKLVEKTKGVEALWILNDGSLDASKGLESSMKSKGAKSGN